jgi:hypothetical protein
LLAGHHITRGIVALGVSKNIRPVQAGISFSEMLAVVCFSHDSPKMSDGYPLHITGNYKIDFF